jgi:multidrug efflux pump
MDFFSTEFMENTQPTDHNNHNSVKRNFGLSTLAINNRTSVVILSLLIAVMGIMAYRTMPKENFPDIVIPTAYINTFYAGNSPIDIENLVTRPIEKELKSINGIKDIKSTSIQDFSVIVVEFDPEVEVSKAIQDTKDAVDKAKSELPSDLDQEPIVQEINVSEIPIMYVNISGDYSLDELKTYAEYLQDEIEKMSEITSADIRGALEREIRINANPYRMEAMNVTFNDISNAIRAENITVSGGNLLADDFRRTLRVKGEFGRVDEIEGVIVKFDNNRIVYLSDVATVSDTYEERESYARESMLPVITLSVVKRAGENLISAADNIKAIIADAKQNRFPEDLRITINNDQSKRTKDQVTNLENSIIFGVLLVVLVLMFFLGLRNALFVGIAIPLSMFMAFMLLSGLGITINMIVLFALILALGMLVDNGIVVVENIYRLMEEEGYSAIRAAKEGVGEVAWPIITSTATTLAAFVPLAFWGGIIGEFMKYLPITLIIVLSSSLFVGLVVNPVLTAIFMKPKEADKVKNRKKLWIWTAAMALVSVGFYLGGFTIMGSLMMLLAILIPLNTYLLDPAVHWFQTVFLVRLENGYYHTVKYALTGKRPYAFFIGTCLLLVLSVALLFWRAPKVEFFPGNEPNYVNIFIEQPIGTDIETTNAFTEKLEARIMEMMEPYSYMVESVTANVGAGASDPNAGPQMGITPHKAKITVAFEEYQNREGVSTAELMERIREEAENYAGVQITVDKDRSGPPVGKPINLEVSGENYEKLIALSEKVVADINNANIAGIEELKTDLETGKPEVLVNIDREKARRYGLSTNAIAQELRTAIFGLEVSKFKEGEDEYPIQLRLQDEYRYDLGALINKRITFRTNDGQMRQVPISAVADVQYSSTYGSVKRKDLDRVISIFSNVKEGYNANETVERIKEVVADMDMPEGYALRFGGEQEEQAKSAEFLSGALMVAVFMIFLIIVAQFNSVITPFIIMASVVLSTIGVFLGLVIFNMNFVIVMTGIGIISLAGVVVNNAIVLIDYTDLIRQRRRKELGIPEDGHLPYDELLNSIIDGGKTRLRPVLLTAITTVLGLIPLAIGLNINFATLLSEFDPQIYVGGDNAIFWGPMAWTVIFGLVFATFLTLVIVPVMYLLADKVKVRFSKV